MGKTIWKFIEGSDNAFVSNNGEIKRNGVIVVPKKDAEGYLRVQVGGIIERERIHRLVAIYHVSNPFGKKYVNHKDGNKENNKSSNLEWCTPRENSLLAYNKGLLFDGEKKKTPVIATDVITGNCEIFDSQGEAARKYKIDDSEINKVLKGKRKTTHGLIFRYLGQEGE